MGGSHGSSLEISIGISRSLRGDLHVIDIHPIVFIAGVRGEPKPEEEIRQIVMMGKVYLDFFERGPGGPIEPTVINPWSMLA